MALGAVTNTEWWCKVEQQLLSQVSGLSSLILPEWSALGPLGQTVAFQLSLQLKAIAGVLPVWWWRVEPLCLCALKNKRNQTSVDHQQLVLRYTTVSGTMLQCSIVLKLIHLFPLSKVFLGKNASSAWLKVPTSSCLFSSYTLDTHAVILHSGFSAVLLLNFAQTRAVLPKYLLMWFCSSFIFFVGAEELIRTTVMHCFALTF